MNTIDSTVADWALDVVNHCHCNYGCNLDKTDDKYCRGDRSRWEFKLSHVGHLSIPPSVSLTWLATLGLGDVLIGAFLLAIAGDWATSTPVERMSQLFGCV